MMHAAIEVSFSRMCICCGIDRLTGQALESLVKVFDVVDGDVADVGHEVGNFASAVGHLLVDVVISKDLVD